MDKAKNSSSKIFTGAALSILSAALLWLAFPPVSFSWAAWFALVPLFVALMKFAPTRAAFGLYYAIMMSLWLLLMALGVPPGYEMMYALPAIFFVVVFLFTFWQRDLLLGRNFKFFTAITASGFVAFEFMRQNSIIGLFGALGVSQFRHVEFIQIVSWFGIFGVSLMIVVANCAIALLIANAKEIGLVKGQVMANVCIVLLLLVFNFVLMRSPIPVTGKVRAAAIQFGIVPEEKNAGPKLERIRKMYIAEDEKGQTEAAMRDLLEPLTKKASAMGAQLIVWPEDAIMVDPDRDAALAARIAALAKESNAMIAAPFIAPLPGKENDKNPEGVNGAVFYNSEGKRVFRYLKQHRIRTLDMELGPKGNTTRLLDAGELGLIGYMICYDSDYPDIATKYAALGAEYFVNSSHDLARFITIHHPYLLMFRGLEHRRSMVKSDIVNGALITDFRGRILSDPPDGTQIAIADVPLTNARTPYPVFSKYLGFGALILFPLFLVFSAMELRKK